MHGPLCSPLARRPGVVHHYQCRRGIRPLNTHLKWRTARVWRQYGPDRCVDAADRWLSECLRLRTFQSRAAWSSSRPVVMGHDGPVSDFLVTYLGAIDERLLDYLDEDDVVRHATEQVASDLMELMAHHPSRHVNTR